MIASNYVALTTTSQNRVNAGMSATTLLDAVQYFYDSGYPQLIQELQTAAAG